MKNNYLSLLYGVSNLFSATASFEDVCQHVVNDIEQSFHFNGAVILLFSEDKKYIYPFAASHAELVRRKLHLLPTKSTDMRIFRNEKHNLIMQSILKKKYLIHKEYKAFAPQITYIAAPLIQRFALIRIAGSFPILFNDKAHGALLVSTSREDFTNNDIHICEVLADIAGSAIENWKLTHELEIKMKCLERSSKFKSEVLEIASHELRTPANIVRSALSMIKDGDIDNEYLYYAKTAAARQIILINNILNSSMIESGAYTLHKTSFPISALIITVAEELKIFIVDKHLEILFDLDATCIVFADEEKIAQVIYNIVFNAIKYTDKGYVKIVCNKRKVEIEITIIDTGVGVNMKDARSIFTKYEHDVAHKERKKTFGTGIGLYISKYIIESHGGYIKVESNGKNGSAFSFTIPL